MDLGTDSGPELLVTVERGLGSPPLRQQLERRLRAMIGSGLLSPGARLPASRVFARDLGVSRRLVVEVYEQLVAEGHLVSTVGSGTFVRAAPQLHLVDDARIPAGVRDTSRLPPYPPMRAPALRYDFFPGSPDLRSFPRRAWARAMTEVLRSAPDAAFGYPDPRGTPTLRALLAEYLRRARGVVGEADDVVVTSGCAQALATLATALRTELGRRPTIAVEDPCLPEHRFVLKAAGARLIPCTVDAAGVRVEEVVASDPDAVLTTPAHQSPTGALLAPGRRAALIAWARDRGRLIIEDDYDAEFRYDRAPVPALQALGADQVAYIGTASKTMAPGLRLGWVVCPRRLAQSVADTKRTADAGSPVLEQLALASLIEDGFYDRHLRSMRRRYAARRRAMLAATEARLPDVRLEGIAAGLHVLLRLPRAVNVAELLQAAGARGVGVYPLALAYAEARSSTDALVLGYASLSESEIEAGLEGLALALRECSAESA